MSTYLEICQYVARESGTIDGTLPTSVTSQTGKLLRIVNWVRDAWVDIQSDEPTWNFLRTEFTASLIASTARYTSASLLINDLSEFRVGRGDDNVLTLFDPSIGQSDEGRLRFLEWEEFRDRYVRNTHDQNRPTEYTVSPQDELCLGPTPDKVYTIRGEYIRTPQRLSANGDIPICPSRFHLSVIGEAALMRLAQFDEAPVLYKSAQNRSRINRMMIDCLPPIQMKYGSIA